MTEKQTVDLAGWLTAIWDEEERLASEALERTANAYPSDRFKVSWRWARAWEFHPSGAGGITTELGAPSPSQVLARIAADRKILACLNAYCWERVSTDGGKTWHLCGRCDRVGCAALRDMASAYLGRPDFPEWLVERQGVEQ